MDLPPSPLGALTLHAPFCGQTASINLVSWPNSHPNSSLSLIFLPQSPLRHLPQCPATTECLTESRLDSASSPALFKAISHLSRAIFPDLIMILPPSCLPWVLTAPRKKPQDQNSLRNVRALRDAPSAILLCFPATPRHCCALCLVCKSPVCFSITYCAFVPLPKDSSMAGFLLAALTPPATCSQD